MSLGREFLEPLLIKRTPEELVKYTKLTLDEFLLYDKAISIQKTLRGCRKSEPITIIEACKSIRMGRSRMKSASCFTINISSNNDLDELFEVPKIIRDSSLYHTYWPSKRISNFLKAQNQFFHAMQPRYKSSPYSPYGGMSRWIFLISGTLSITLFKPVDSIRARYSSLDDHDRIIANDDLQIPITLYPGQILVIPPNYICVMKAKRTSFAMSGEFLQRRNVSAQMEGFERDILDCHGRYSHERDSEIRWLYWFFVARLLTEIKNQEASQKENAITFNEIDKSSLDCLKRTLMEWKNLHKKTFIEKNIYAPIGIQIDLIVKDLSTLTLRLDKKHKRASLQGEKNSVNIVGTQTSVDIKSD